MQNVRKIILGMIGLFCCANTFAQTLSAADAFTVTVINGQKEIVEGAVVEISKDSIHIVDIRHFLCLIHHNFTNKESMS